MSIKDPPARVIAEGYGPCVPVLGETGPVPTREQLTRVRPDRRGNPDFDRCVPAMGLWIREVRIKDLRELEIVVEYGRRVLARSPSPAGLTEPHRPRLIVGN